jgi:hypothetical protein
LHVLLLGIAGARTRLCFYVLDVGKSVIFILGISG